jgi:hypothetical protein
MEDVSIHPTDVIAKLVPGGAQNLVQLSDDELLANTRRLVGKSNQLLAALLQHLAEVEARGVHRARSCASLYTYCIYELRFSEDAAARRSAAARLAREFPALLGAVAAGELHLTGLLMIGPHLTLENHQRVLGRAKFRTKKEVAKLVRELSPLPGVLDCIEPLGPAPARPLTNPTWAQFVTSLAPQVRDLPAGERPCDWANDGTGVGAESSAPEALTLADEALPVGPVPSGLPPITGPQQFQMQFATVEEHVQMVERAKALFGRSRPGVTLGELHLEAMKLLVAALEKRKFAITERGRAQSPRQRGAATDDVRETSAVSHHRRVAPDIAGEAPVAADAPRQRVATSTHWVEARQRGRYVPAAVRREVYRRDGACCTYTDARGHKCGEARCLELHHLQPFAKGGNHSAANLTLRCAAHNALAAEEDFGREIIAERRHSTRHESRAAQTRVDKSPHK